MKQFIFIHMKLKSLMKPPSIAWAFHNKNMCNLWYACGPKPLSLTIWQSQVTKKKKEKNRLKYDCYP